MDLPIRYIGTGEKLTDLAEFDARQFVSALFS
jgi:signal recognition particle GTPase